MKQQLYLSSNYNEEFWFYILFQTWLFGDTTTRLLENWIMYYILLCLNAYEIYITTQSFWCYAFILRKIIKIFHNDWYYGKFRRHLNRIIKLIYGYMWYSWWQLHPFKSFPRVLKSFDCKLWCPVQTEHEKDQG